MAGTGVVFQGTGTDPDIDPGLTFLWDFGGGAPDSTLEDSGEIVFAPPGIYPVTFEVTDSLGATGTDQLVVTATTATGNLPPTVSAGPDRFIGIFYEPVLDGTVAADGLPASPGALDITWRRISGPGTASFADSGAVDTTASFTAPGTYVLELEADDGELAVGDELTITVTAVNIIRVPLDYPTIQSAVDAAIDQDLVLIAPGVYGENVVVAGKTVTLASEFYTTGDRSLIEQTIIEASATPGKNGFIAVYFDQSAGPGTLITGLTIRNGEDGVRTDAKINVIDNRFVDNYDGIDYHMGGGVLQDNYFDASGDDAMDLDNETELLVERNLIQNSRDDGIEIRFNPYTGPTLDRIVRDNMIARNGRTGIQLIDYGTNAQPDLTDRYIRIERNVFLENGIAALGMMDNAETREDLRAANIPEPVDVISNTFVGNVNGISGGNNLVAINNIFANTTDIAVKNADTDSTLAYNLFWNNGVDNQGSNVDLGTTLFDDPLLDANHLPQSGSPAIDAGTAFFVWRGIPVLDLAPGQYSSPAPDLGAYEVAQ